MAIWSHLYVEKSQNVLAEGDELLIFVVCLGLAHGLYLKFRAHFDNILKKFFLIFFWIYKHCISERETKMKYSFENKLPNASGQSHFLILLMAKSLMK